MTSLVVEPPPHKSIKPQQCFGHWTGVSWPEDDCWQVPLAGEFHKLLTLAFPAAFPPFSTFAISAIAGHNHVFAKCRLVIAAQKWKLYTMSGSNWYYLLKKVQVVRRLNCIVI